MTLRLDILTAAVFVTALTAACSKQAIRNLYDSQETVIENFVNAQSDSASTVTYRNGSVRLTTVQGSGDTLTRGGSLSFYYAGYTLSGTSVSNSNLFWTNRKETADAAGWTLSDSTVFTPETVRADDPRLVPGLQNGLIGVRSGEECYILFSGRYGFGQKAVGTISAKSALVYRIWVENITNE